MKGFISRVLEVALGSIIVNIVLGVWYSIDFSVPEPRQTSIVYNVTVATVTPMPTVITAKVVPVNKTRISGGSRLVWKNLYELEAYNNAYKAKQTTFGMIGNSDTIILNVGTLINVLQECNGYYRIEVLEGKHGGVIGWIDFLPNYQSDKWFAKWQSC